MAAPRGAVAARERGSHARLPPAAAGAAAPPRLRRGERGAAAAPPRRGAAPRVAMAGLGAAPRGTTTCRRRPRRRRRAAGPRPAPRRCLRCRRAGSGTTTGVSRRSRAGAPQRGRVPAPPSAKVSAGGVRASGKRHVPGGRARRGVQGRGRWCLRAVPRGTGRDRAVPGLVLALPFLWPAAGLAGCVCVEGLVAFVAALLRPGFQKRNREPSVPCGGCDRFCSTASAALGCGR